MLVCTLDARRIDKRCERGTLPFVKRGEDGYINDSHALEPERSIYFAPYEGGAFSVRPVRKKRLPAN